MTKLSNSSAEPSYIPRLALSSAPFSKTIDEASFYNGEQIEQRLNLLLHLARSSDKVGLLLAEEGVGKSTLLTQVQLNSGDDLRVCRIDAHASLDSPTFIAKCLRSFGVDDAGELQNRHEELLKERVKRLLKLNIRPLLLIDDIDAISADNLAIIMDWLSWQDEGEYLLQAIVTANRTMPELDNIHGRLQRVDLPSLAESELDAYLMHRLEAVGFTGELPFSTKDLKQFYRQSAGLPALVNQLAHQTLLGIKVSSKPASRSGFKATSLVRWIGVAVLALTLILLLVFQDKINDLFKQEESHQVDSIDQSFNAEEETVTTIVVGDDSIIDAEQAERDELAQLVSELPAVDEQENGAIEEQNKATTMDEIAIGTSDIEAVENLIPETTERVQVAEEVKIKEPEDVFDSVPLPHQQNWILQQQATHYTFQLMGSWEHEEVLEFIDKYELSGDLAEFQSDRNGRVWYALIYGVYENKQIALQQSSRWPAPLNTLPSWLRRFDSVQKQLKSTAQ